MDHYRFHLLGLAHVPTSKEYQSCAYTQKIVNLTKMLTGLGHQVFLYCGEGSDTVATEQIQVVSAADRDRVYGKYDWHTEFFKHDPKDECHQIFNANAIREINRRKEPQDFLLCPMGNYQEPIANAVNLMTVESGIGYTGVFSKHRVFESYAWMHYIYGLLKEPNGSWYDAVIQNYYDPIDFPFSTETKKSNYYLFIGRLIQRKGLQIAIETTEKIGAKLIVAGQGDLKDVEGRDFSSYKHVEHIGTVGAKDRANLYAHALATFTPTNYIGPFEGVAVESQLCGTPVITTDWGVFAETVQHGKTGYRCHTFDDFVWSALNAPYLNPVDCHKWALENYSLNRVQWKYQEYFTKLHDLWGEGWYTLRPWRQELNWLKEY